jgi:hypothetical protein
LSDNGQTDSVSGPAQPTNELILPANSEQIEKRVMKRTYILLAGMAACVVLAAPASAATSTVTGTVTAGTLSIDTAAAPTFGVTLDGTDQVATYTVPTTVTDARPTAAGT